jgi:hypothetical protein
MARCFICFILPANWRAAWHESGGLPPHEMPGFSALISVSLNSVALQFVSVLSSRLLNNVDTFLYPFHISSTCQTIMIDQSGDNLIYGS